MIHTSAVSGVNSEGFMTIVHPQAKAGATFRNDAQDQSSSGQTPQGTLTFHALDNIVKTRLENGLVSDSPHVNRVVPRNAIREVSFPAEYKYSGRTAHLATNANWLMTSERDLGFIINLYGLS
jgi:hypothetical protein